ncbi:MAG: aminotransferase class I/II-fold pyridoxal phosphate-dependent enzyme [Selenomonadaceae bacterium]|nr:aminotransferase class I/II-fold pyridoxal phosphate-dependent enzyme [Selenomonadaceae bacterium]
MEKFFAAPIVAAMKKYSADNVTPFHTPGHKHGRGAHELLRELLTAEGLRQEVSLMDELDDLHAPHSCIKEAQELAARLWHADECIFMVNGTTSAVQAMIFGTLKPGDLIMIPRNAHRSVIAGLILSGAVPIFLPVDFDKKFSLPLNVSVSTIERAIKNFPRAKAILLVSPNYYGVSADVKKISELAHAANMLLLVDEAHGAHLQFSDELPPSAMDAGADLSAQSTHKILGSLTQSSMLMLKKIFVDVERVKRAASLLQTTSPNQLLLASLDIARLQMEVGGREKISNAINLSRQLRSAIKNLRGLKIFDGAKNFSFDATKVTVNVNELGLTGQEAEEILRRELKIQCELSDAANVLFLITFADDESTVAKLIDALKKLPRRPKKILSPAITSQKISVAEIAPRETFYSPVEAVALDEAAEKICAEEITFYPPGIPLIMPGEKISAQVVEMIRREKILGSCVIGASDKTLSTIKIFQSK